MSITISGSNGIDLNGTPIYDGRNGLNDQKSITITPPTDADYTLTADENAYGRFVLNLPNWTTARNIIVDNNERSFIVDNSAGAYTATIKTSTGTGVAVASETDPIALYCDGTDVVVNTTGVVVVDDNYIDLDAVGANPQAKLYSDGTIVGSTDNGSYVKYPNGFVDMFATTGPITASVTSYASFTWVFPITRFVDEHTGYWSTGLSALFEFTHVSNSSQNGIAFNYRTRQNENVTGTYFGRVTTKGRWK